MVAKSHEPSSTVPNPRALRTRIEGFWAQRPYDIRLLGHFEGEGPTTSTKRTLSP